MDSPSIVEAKRYLFVDQFLQNLVGAAALKTAFELHLMERLVDNVSVTRKELLQTIKVDRQGFDMLLELLSMNHVVELLGEEVRLTEQFARVWPFRDLLQTKLELAMLVTVDLADLPASLFSSPAKFQEKARIFRLFDYQRCFELTPENYEATKRWMQFTSTLTRYETPVVMQYYDFSRHKRLLDVGGNSGEFLFQLCQKNSYLQGTVFDLPVVCVVGREHLLQKAEGDRIRFVKGSAIDGVFPKGHDSITFKSMLHDWPDELAARFLSKAVDALETGGTLIVFERSPMRGAELFQFSNLPMLLFFRSFREPAFYEEHLLKLGMVDVSVQWIDLESSFFLLTARKTRN